MKLFLPFSFAAVTAVSARAVSQAFEEELKLTPIQRVTKLLKEMQSQLAADSAKDEEMAGKLACWCKTNKEEKETAVKAGDARTDELRATINENSAKKGKLGAQIAQEKKDLYKLRQALDQATAIREKERSGFREEELELVKTVTNLKNAIQVLGSKSFVQLSAAQTTSIQALVHSASMVHEAMFGEAVPAAATKNVAFLQSSEGAKAGAVFLQAMDAKFKPAISSHSASKLVASLAQGPAHLGKYSQQSVGIVGILKSMNDNFEKDMSENAKSEDAAQKAFETLKASSTQQIKATEASKSNHKSQLAEAVKELAEAKEELEKTRDVRAADVEFLQNLQGQCMDIEHQAAARQKERAEETVAVSEALSILSDDDTRDLLRKTASFLQLSATRQANKTKAAAFLRKASRAAPGWEDLGFQWAGSVKAAPRQQLAVLASSAQLDAFTTVKQAMDKMAAEIKQQMADDVKHRDFCVSEFNKNGKDTKAADHQRQDAESKIDDLAAQIADLKQQIADAQGEIANTRVEIKKAGEDREAENKLFQDNLNEQRATQAVLNKVIARLNQYYAEKNKVDSNAFLQQQPPAQFESYNKNNGGNTVIVLIEKISGDSKKMENEAVADESSAQAAYETFVADSNNAIKQLQNQITSNSQTSAEKAAEKVATEESLASTNTSLDNLAAYKADLHGQCDFLSANFEVRQQAMQNEIEAIQEAKAILSGAK